MRAVLRRFSGGFGVSEDYLRLREFLAGLGYAAFTYARLDWMITHAPNLAVDRLDRIGLWEEDGKLVAAALFDTTLDDVFLIAAPGREALRARMIDYAQTVMAEDNPEYRLMIPDGDVAFQRLAARMGYIATPDKEMDACYDLLDERGMPCPPPDPRPCLPEGYSLISLYEERDWEKYLRCLHKGFGHEEAGEAFEYDDGIEQIVRASMERAQVDLKLKIAVKAPDGEYAAYCGMWYDSIARFAVIEPVATVPAERMRGLGRAAVTEGIRRVCERGARFAVVGSSQQFYYSIGLRPLATGTFWRRAR